MTGGSLFIKSAIILICLFFAVIAGCSVFQIKVTETYASEYETTVQASMDTLDGLEIDILRVISDRLNTTIIARRPEGTLVTIEVIRIDQNHTKVTVKSDDGIFEERVSKMIHEYINEKLSATCLPLQEHQTGERIKAQWS